MCCEPVFADPQILGLSRVSQDHHSTHANLPPLLESARHARRFVHRVTDPLLGEDRQRDAALMASELVTNAIIHARTPLQVGVTWWDDELLLAVGDRDQAVPEQHPYSPERANGRGLPILEALSKDWGVTVYDGGKTTWVILDR